MSLSFEQKQAVVAEVRELAASAYSALAAEYSGITVEEMTALRVQARADGVVLRVVKNSLAKRAFEGTDFACMNDGLSGPLVLAFSLRDPGAAARVLDGYARQNEKLLIKLVAIDGRIYGADEVKRLAGLPTKERAIGMLMSVIQAPTAKLARTLNEVPAKLARVLLAIRAQKQAS